MSLGLYTSLLFSFLVVDCVNVCACVLYACKSGRGRFG